MKLFLSTPCIGGEGGPLNLLICKQNCNTLVWQTSTQLEAIGWLGRFSLSCLTPLQYFAVNFVYTRASHFGSLSFARYVLVCRKFILWGQGLSKFFPKLLITGSHSILYTLDEVIDTSVTSCFNHHLCCMMCFWACTKTRNGETKPPKRPKRNNQNKSKRKRNHRNSWNETTERTKTTETK